MKSVETKKNMLKSVQKKNKTDIDQNLHQNQRTGTGPFLIKKKKQHKYEYIEIDTEDISINEIISK